MKKKEIKLLEELDLVEIKPTFETDTDEYIHKQIKQFNLTDNGIAELHNKYGHLKIKNFEDKEGYKIVKAARLAVRGYRTELEKKRKELVENPMRIKQAIDAEAKRRTLQIASIENALYTQEQEFEAEQLRIKEENERLEREAKEAREEKIRLRKRSLHQAGFVFDGESWRLVLDRPIFTILDTEIDEDSDDEFENFISVSLKAKIEYEDELKEKAQQERLEAEKTEAEKQKIIEAQKAVEETRKKAIQEEIERVKAEQIKEAERLENYRMRLEEEAKNLAERNKEEEEIFNRMRNKIYKDPESIKSVVHEIVNAENQVHALSENEIDTAVVEHSHTFIWIASSSAYRCECGESKTKEGFEISNETPEEIPKFENIREILTNHIEKDINDQITIIKQALVQILHYYEISMEEITFDTNGENFTFSIDDFSLVECHLGNFFDEMQPGREEVF